MKSNAASRSRSFVESLEHRTLLSASADPALHADAAAPVTHTKLHVSRHTAKLGQSVVFTATVSAAKKIGAVAGSVEFLNDGTPIATPTGDLSVPLGAHNRATYNFSSGNIALFVGRQSFSAEFISSNGLPNSTSKATIVNVTVPKLKTASDGLETATVKPGHGKPIKAGQTATVVYTGFLASDGTIFDYATADHGAGVPPTYTFVVEGTTDQPIAGFDQGTLGMRVGETRVMAIPSALGYGSAGQGTSIPANADLVFLVTLESISATSS